MPDDVVPQYLLNVIEYTDSDIEILRLKCESFCVAIYFPI